MSGCPLCASVWLSRYRTQLHDVHLSKPSSCSSFLTIGRACSCIDCPDSELCVIGMVKRLTRLLLCVQDLTEEILEASLTTCRAEVNTLVEQLAQFSGTLDPVMILGAVSNESITTHTSKRLLVCTSCRQREVGSCCAHVRTHAFKRLICCACVTPVIAGQGAAIACVATCGCAFLFACAIGQCHMEEVHFVDNVPCYNTRVQTPSLRTAE